MVPFPHFVAFYAASSSGSLRLLDETVCGVCQAFHLWALWFFGALRFLRSQDDAFFPGRLRLYPGHEADFLVPTFSHIDNPDLLRRTILSLLCSRALPEDLLPPLPLPPTSLPPSRKRCRHFTSLVFDNLLPAVPPCREGIPLPLFPSSFKLHCVFFLFSAGPLLLPSLTCRACRRRFVLLKYDRHCFCLSVFLFLAEVFFPDRDTLCRGCLSSSPAFVGFWIGRDGPLRWFIVSALFDATVSCRIPLCPPNCQRLSPMSRGSIARGCFSRYRFFSWTPPRINCH